MIEEMVKYWDKEVLENENDNPTNFLDYDNILNKMPTYQISNNNQSQDSIGVRKNKFYTTRHSTVMPDIYRKRRKKHYGKWIKYPEQEKIEDIPIPINPFLNKNIELNNKVRRYFCKDPAHFISRRAIELKTYIIDFGQKAINKRISDYDNNKTKYLLRYIDYEKFCVPHSKEFNERYLVEKLENLFIEFQDSDYDICKGQNKKVIDYVKNNSNKLYFALDLLDLNFYEFVKWFADVHLDKYLEDEDKELKELYLKNNINNYKKRIEAFNQIIRTLCNNFEEYSTSF